MASSSSSSSAGSEIESSNALELEKLFKVITSQFSPVESEDVVESLKRNYGGKFNLLHNQDLLSCLQLLHKHGHVSDDKLTLIEEFVAPKSNKEELIKTTIDSFKAARQTRVEPRIELQGRQYEIKEITRELETDKAYAVNLFGSAGVGKTTLANEVCSKWRGKHFVFDLREAKDMMAIYLNMMNSFGLTFPVNFGDQNYLVSRIHNHIQSLKSEAQPVLFLLENVDQFTAGQGKEGKNLTTAFVQFLESLSHFDGKDKKTSSKVLLTSRTQLHGTKTVHNFEVKSLESTFSEKLLVSKVMASVKTDQKNHLIEISKGKPLLLKGLAAILRQERKSADDLIAGVHKGKVITPKKLKSEEDRERMDIVQLSVIREMFDTLPTDSLKVSAVAISLFCGPFSISTAAKVLGISQSEALAQLEGLVASAIIFVVDEETRDRMYDIHPLLRKYADSIKDDAKFQRAYLEAKGRFHQHFMTKMANIAKLIEPDYVRAFKLFECDRPNYEFTVKVSLQPEYFSVPSEFRDKALIALLFNTMLAEDKQIKLFHSWAEMCEDDGQSGSLCRAQFKCWEAQQVLVLQGTQRTFQVLKEASHSLEKVQDKSSEDYRLSKGLFLYSEGQAYFRNRDYKRAIESLESSLKFTEELLKINTGTDLARCYSAIGNCYYGLDKPMKALEFYKIAHQMTVRLAGSEYHFDMPMYKNQIGTVYESQGDYDKAIEYYKEALQLLNELKLSGFHNEAFFCRNLANALMFQKKHHEAVAPADRAYNIRMKILGNHPLTVQSIFQRAVIQANFGKINEALKLFLEAWEMEKSLAAGNHSAVWRKIITGVEDMYDFLAKGFKQVEKFLPPAFSKKGQFKEDALKFCQRFWKEQREGQFGFTEFNKDIIDAIMYLVSNMKDKREAEKEALWFYDGMQNVTEEEFQEKIDQETDSSRLNEMLKERDGLLDKVIEFCLQVDDHEKLTKHINIKLVLFKKVFMRSDFVGKKEYGYDKVTLKGKVEQLYRDLGQKEKIPEFRENLLCVWQKHWEEGKDGEKTEKISVARERIINSILQLCKELKRNEMFRRYGKEALVFYENTWEVKQAKMRPPEMKKFLREMKQLASSIGDQERVKYYREVLQDLKKTEKPPGVTLGTKAIQPAPKADKEEEEEVVVESEQGITLGPEEEIEIESEEEITVGSEEEHLEKEEHLVQFSLTECNKNITDAEMYFPDFKKDKYEVEALGFEGKQNATQEEVQGSLVPPEIQAQGHRAEVAYHNALQNGSVQVNRGRVMLLGHAGAGKTSLKKHLLGIPFDPGEESTIGVEVDTSKCELEVAQVKNWQCTEKKKLDLCEFKEGIAKMIAADLKASVDEEHITKDNVNLEQEQLGAQGFEQPDSTPTVAATTPDSNQENKQKIDAFGSNVPRRSIPGDQDIQSTTVSTAILPNNDTEEVINASKSERMPALQDLLRTETTAALRNDIKEMLVPYLRGLKLEDDIKDKEVIFSVWDFAGQHVYYASHCVFLSLRALYVLVCDLSNDLSAPAEPLARKGTHDIILENPTKQTNLDNLLSWLVSLHCMRPTTDGAVDKKRTPAYLRPPVFIVGTHADTPFQDITEMKTCIEKSILGKTCGDHYIRSFFAVDNTRSLSDYGVQSLQNKIMEVLEQEPYFGEEVPMRWVHFEKVVEAMVQKKTYHMDLDELQTITKEVCCIDDEKELSTMLNFYHDLGVIVKHGRTVVLQTQWLIDLFKQLITVPPFEEVAPLYSKYWQQLEKRGILRMALVDHVFADFIQKGLSKEDILNMMELYGLIAKFSFHPEDEEHEESYFVPCQLTSSPSVLYEIKPSVNDPCPLYLDFRDGFVPHGFFPQLLSRCIKWCSAEYSFKELPNLCHNGARFTIGKEMIFELILICRNRFIKVTLKRKNTSDPSTTSSVTMARAVRAFLEDTLQDMSCELSWLRNLQYKLSVACAHCLKCTDPCDKHRSVFCTHDDCLHLLPLRSRGQMICPMSFDDEPVAPVGLEQWLTVRETEFSPEVGIEASSHVVCKQQDPLCTTATLKVTLLGDEWASSAGGLSTLNRELAIHLAKHRKVEVTFFVPEGSCTDEQKRTAHQSYGITVIEAKELLGYDRLDWLSFPPQDLVMDVVVGHGVKLGHQGQVLKDSRSCKWVQVVHTAPEQLSAFKIHSGAISKGGKKHQIEVGLGKLADLVVPIGPKLAEAYSSYLRSKKCEGVFPVIPGLFREFEDLTQDLNESSEFNVLLCGRGDAEDFELKGYDVAAKAFAEDELKDGPYRLLFVGAPDGKEDEVAKKLLKCGIAKVQLTVRKFIESREKMADLFCEVDLAIMPSRTEGFGLIALEALSAGLPILVSGNSGFAKALQSLQCDTSLCIVNSNEPKDWAKAIKAVRARHGEHLQEIELLRESYGKRYSWDKQCEALVEKMWNMVHGTQAQH